MSRFHRAGNDATKIASYHRSEKKRREKAGRSRHRYTYRIVNPGNTNQMLVGPGGGAELKGRRAEGQ